MLFHGKRLSLLAVFFLASTLLLCCTSVSAQSDEIRLIKLETPDKINAGERYPVYIHYESNLPPEQVLERITSLQFSWSGESFDFSKNEIDLKAEKPGVLAVKLKTGRADSYSLECRLHYSDGASKKKTNSVSTRIFVR